MHAFMYVQYRVRTGRARVGQYVQMQGKYVHVYESVFLSFFLSILYSISFDMFPTHVGQPSKSSPVAAPRLELLQPLIITNIAAGISL